MAGFRKGSYGVYRYKETAKDRAKFIRGRGHRASVRKVSSKRGYDFSTGGKRVIRKNAYEVRITGHKQSRRRR